ncbi:MAG TPA: hypothetical protein VGQ12_07415 [Candidatus Angelobacter sp.]|jgi:hypothetical protein|nr:hypothetical protein [Candidatus Angelobacter sp.]
MAEKVSALATVPPQPVAIAPERSSILNLAPRNFDEAMRFSKLLADSDLAPKDFKGKPANVLIALQMGCEVGLAPMAAIQNIAVINGRPSIWGDAALAIVMAHRDFENIKETFEGANENKTAICEVKRRGHDPHIARFSVADAKKAQLWGKQGPWTNYPDRMLQMRARGWAIRDKFADALRGLNIGEEMQDAPTIEASTLPQIDPAKETLKNEIDALLTSVGVNAANRMAILSANDADLAGCLAALKTIKLVLTDERIPVQQWPALLQKQMRNLDNYAKGLKEAHEKKNCQKPDESPAQPAETATSAEPATPEGNGSAAPNHGQQPAHQGTGAATCSGDSRPAAGPQDDLFISKEETQPKQSAANGGKGRFKF